jgi:hypothetical protein
MPLCRHRHRLTTIHGVLGSKNAIHRMNTSRNFLIKIPKKRIIKKINNYSVFLSASVVPIIIKKISSKEDNIVTPITRCFVYICCDRCEKKQKASHKRSFNYFLITIRSNLQDKTWSIAWLTLSNENGFSRKTSAPFSIATSRAVPNPDIMMIFIFGYFFLT